MSVVKSSIDIIHIYYRELPHSSESDTGHMNSLRACTIEPSVKAYCYILLMIIRVTLQLFLELCAHVWQSLRVDRFKKQHFDTA